MARRSKSVKAGLIGLALVVGLPLVLAQKILATTGWVIPLAAMVGIACLALVIWAMKRRERMADLRRKYPEDIVQRILARKVWQGQTEGELIDTLGRPAEVDKKVLKTIRREIWKYGRKSTHRFQLRVTVENGTVAGWDQKA